MKRTGAWGLWWLACFWFWMLLVGSWDRIDIVAGAIVAAAAGAIATSAMTAAGAQLRLPLERIRAGATVPLIVLVDFGIVTWALLRRRRGRYLARPFDAGPKGTVDGVNHRAWTILLSGYSPNAYVVDVDAERDVVLLHDLVPYRRSEEPA